MCSFKKTFWKTICHEGFQPEIRQLNDDEALKYLPTIQQSCKIINSDEELCVQLFNSTYINGNKIMLIICLNVERLKFCFKICIGCLLGDLIGLCHGALFRRKFKPNT